MTDQGEQLQFDLTVGLPSLPQNSPREGLNNMYPSARQIFGRLSLGMVAVSVVPLEIKTDILHQGLPDYLAAAMTNGSLITGALLLVSARNRWEGSR